MLLNIRGVYFYFAQTDLGLQNNDKHPVHLVVIILI